MNLDYNDNLKTGYKLIGKYCLPQYDLSQIHINIQDGGSKYSLSYQSYLDNDIYNFDNEGIKLTLDYQMVDYKSNRYNIKSFDSESIYIDNLNTYPIIDCDYGIVADVSFCFGIPNIQHFQIKPYNLSYRHTHTKMKYIIRDNYISKISYYRSINEKDDQNIKDLSYSIINTSAIYDICNNDTILHSGNQTHTDGLGNEINNNIRNHIFYIDHKVYSLLNNITRSGYNQNHVLKFNTYYDPSINILSNFLKKNNIKLLELNFDTIKKFVKMEYKKNIIDISNTIWYTIKDFIKNKIIDISNNYSNHLFLKSSNSNIYTINEMDDNWFSNTSDIGLLSFNNTIYSNDTALLNDHPHLYILENNNVRLYEQFLYLFYYKYNFDISGIDATLYGLNIQQTIEQIKRYIDDNNFPQIAIRLASIANFLDEDFTDNFDIKNESTYKNINDISFTDITNTYNTPNYKKKIWTPIFYNGEFENSISNSISALFYEKLVNYQKTKDFFYNNLNSAYYYNFQNKFENNAIINEGIFDNLPYYELYNWIGFQVPFQDNSDCIITVEQKDYFDIFKLFNNIIPNLKITPSNPKKPIIIITIYNPFLNKNKNMIIDISKNSLTPNYLWYIKDDDKISSQNYYKYKPESDDVLNKIGFPIHSNDLSELNNYKHFNIFFGLYKTHNINDTIHFDISNIGITNNSINIITDNVGIINLKQNIIDISKTIYKNISELSNLYNQDKITSISINNNDEAIALSNINDVFYLNKNNYTQFKHFYKVEKQFVNNKYILIIYFTGLISSNYLNDYIKYSFKSMSVKGKIIKINNILNNYNIKRSVINVELINNITHDFFDLKNININYIGERKITIISSVLYMNEKYIMVNNNEYSYYIEENKDDLKIIIESNYNILGNYISDISESNIIPIKNVIKNKKTYSLEYDENKKTDINNIIKSNYQQLYIGIINYINKSNNFKSQPSQLYDYINFNYNEHYNFINTKQINMDDIKNIDIGKKNKYTYYQTIYSNINDPSFNTIKHIRTQTGTNYINYIEINDKQFIINGSINHKIIYQTGKQYQFNIVRNSNTNFDISYNNSYNNDISINIVNDDNFVDTDYFIIQFYTDIDISIQFIYDSSPDEKDNFLLHFTNIDNEIKSKNMRDVSFNIDLFEFTNTYSIDNTSNTTGLDNTQLVVDNTTDDTNIDMNNVETFSNLYETTTPTTSTTPTTTTTSTTTTTTTTTSTTTTTTTTTTSQTDTTSSYNSNNYYYS